MISITRLLTALRDYRRTLLEIDTLTDHDLQDLAVSRDTLSRAAWSEARRRCAPDESRAEQLTDAVMPR